MDWLPLNAFDLIVLGIFLLSGVLAFARGMAKEILRLAAWVGAGYAAIYGFAFARPYARDVIPVDFLADSVAGIGIFLLALVVFLFLANLIAGHLKDGSLGALDRSLGFLFGLVRGAVIVSLAYLFLGWIATGENLPNWIVEAKSRPLVEQGAALLVRIAPRRLRDEAAATAEATRARARKAIEAERKVRELSAPPATRDSGETRPGYSGKERKEMDRLIRNNQ